MASPFNSTYSGLGGLFGGFTNGLEILSALQRAQAERELRAREAAVNEGQLALEQKKFQATEEDKPYTDIQDQLNRQHAYAGLSDIRREYTPPSVADTYRPTTQFAPPQHLGASGVLAPPAPTKPPLPGIATSHMGQVLERANRTSNFQRNQDVLTGVLAAAGQRAQKTQVPVAGSFDTGAGKATLPSGFTVQPERTFSPWQMTPRVQRDPRDDLYKPLLNNPTRQMILQQTDPAAFAQFQAWAAERLGTPSEATAGATGNKSVAQWIAEVRADPKFKNATPPQIAAEAKRRAGAP